MCYNTLDSLMFGLKPAEFPDVWAQTMPPPHPPAGDNSTAQLHSPQGGVFQFSELPSTHSVFFIDHISNRGPFYQTDYGGKPPHQVRTDPETPKIGRPQAYIDVNSLNCFSSSIQYVYHHDDSEDARSLGKVWINSLGNFSVIGIPFQPWCA